jgi:replication-associated recombination protein RarA
MRHQKLLSEQLRPSVIDDIVVLPEQTLASLKKMILERSPMNMIFYGKAGTGKTSTVRILMKELDLDVLELNGSNHGGISNSVQMFSTTMSLEGKLKLVYIDEADYLHKDVQANLRYPIENSSNLVRFIFTANDLSRFQDAIKSRCIPICFDVTVSNILPTIDRMVERYVTKLKNLGYIADRQLVRNIVCSHFPNFRAIANQFQFELVTTDEQKLSA